MFRKLLALVAILLTAGTSVTLANDWTGAYAGLHTGYASGRDSVKEVNGPRTYYVDPEGMQGGVHAGWLQQFDRVVAGVEGELGYLGQSGSTVRTDGFGSVRSSVDLGAYGTATGRLGYLVHPDWLLFGTAGLTIAKLDAKTSQSCPTGTCMLEPSSASTRDHAWGFVFGGGAEHAFSERWRGRIEYRYTDYRRELALPSSGPGWNHDLDSHALRVSIDRTF